MWPGEDGKDPGHSVLSLKDHSLVNIKGHLQKRMRMNTVNNVYKMYSVCVTQMFTVWRTMAVICNKKYSENLSSFDNTVITTVFVRFKSLKFAWPITKILEYQ